MSGFASINKEERQEMMESMMEHCFGGMGVDEKKEMCATMMGKMTEGLNMKEMMPKMMMGMMAGDGNGSTKMPDMMAKMRKGGPEQHMAQMPEMMLKMMMPHCIGMMLPAMEAEKRGDAAAAILSALVEKGTIGLSEEQSVAYRKKLAEVLKPSA